VKKKLGTGIVSLNPLIFNSILDVEKLETILEKMITKFVLCTTCGLPEYRQLREL
jgi:translation initiation factor 2 beta subunit (eIF-2beta)/eIF-5